jgi:hypothetical protein
MSDVPLSCRCGKIRGRLDPAAGTRLVCHCADCRAAARHVASLARGGLTATEDVAAAGPDRAVHRWPEPGAAWEGADIYQTTPDRLRIEAGHEHLRAIRLSPGGLVRWYASCCATPLANTLGSTGMPFVGLLAHAVAPAARAGLGAPKGEVNMRGPDGRVRHRGFAAIGLALLRRALVSRLAGRERRAPFFRPDGTPISAPHILTEAERTAAYGT